MKISEFYNNISDQYEKLINSSQVNAQLLKHLKDIFSKHGIKNGTILDVGCGPGNLKSELGNNFSYTGIDIAEGMLMNAEKKGYTTILGKLETILPTINDKSFDYAVSVSALYFVKDINWVIEQFERIAKKGWLISLADITNSYREKFPVEESLYNHVKIPLTKVDEDIYFEAWTSPTAKETISERMIFKNLNQ